MLSSSEGPRRIRDAVEVVLSDILLLDTEAQVHRAAKAATERAAGRPTHTAELVTSLTDCIRQVRDLEPISPNLSIPRQGPTRIAAMRGKGESAGKSEPSVVAVQRAADRDRVVTWAASVQAMGMMRTPNHIVSPESRSV